VSEYSSTLTAQEDRLLGVGWLENKLKDTHVCPVCTAVHKDGSPRLAELVTLASELKALTASVTQAPAKLDHELADLRQELRDRENAISKVRQKRRHLEAQSSDLARQRLRIREVYLFVGRVEQALENVTASRKVDDLQKRVNELAEKIAKLKLELDPHSQRERVKASLATVSAKIAEYAKMLNLEHANENVSLSLRELTLQFTPLSGRTDFLWEVGSGQNWVGYHVAGLLALHEHFTKLSTNPVPRFLIFDQPSQVYFPEAWPSMEGAPTITPKKADISSDIEGVRRIFRALAHFTAAVDHKFQIIVTEHAGSITWENIPDIHLVGNWRDGHDDFLILNSWTAGT
jgi:hypothetical protein